MPYGESAKRVEAFLALTNPHSLAKELDTKEHHVTSLIGATDRAQPC